MTSTPLGVARARVAGILMAAELGVPIHSSPPDAPARPAVWVRPGYDWLAKTQLGPCVQVQLEVEIGVPVHGGTRTTLDAAEHLAWQVWGALTGAALKLDPVRGPETRTLGAATMAVASITVTQQIPTEGL